MSAKTSKKSPIAKPVKVGRDQTLEEELADMRAYGKEQSRTKESALAFLHRLGIVTPKGKLTKRYRAV